MKARSNATAYGTFYVLGWGEIDCVIEGYYEPGYPGDLTGPPDNARPPEGPMVEVWTVKVDGPEDDPLPGGTDVTKMLSPEQIDRAEDLLIDAMADDDGLPDYDPREDDDES